MNITLNHNFEEFLEPCPINHIRFRQDKDLFLSYGGRGGAKSHGWAEVFSTMMRFRAGYKLLCVREFQNSIEDSVYALLQGKADDLFPNFFSFKNNRMYGKNGSYASFIGLSRNIGSAKSLEGYDGCWVEEGQYLSAKGWEILEPTIRKDQSKIAISMNRDSEDAILDTTFIQNEPPETAMVKKINYYDNPYPIPKLERMAEHCRKTNYKAYRHIWLGELNRIDEAEVFHGKWRTEKFETPEDAIFYHGVDWGFGAHPTAIVRCYIKENTLYIDKAGYYWRSDLEDLPELFTKDVPTSKTWRIIADSANPAEIRYIRNKGFDVWGVKKGTIESGIRYLRSYDCIVIHEDLKHLIAEAKNYKYKLDPKTGDVLPILIKEHDHGWDAIRYALSRLIAKGAQSDY